MLIMYNLTSTIRQNDSILRGVKKNPSENSQLDIAKAQTRQRTIGQYT